jgi:CRP-like cAMP-binding protein
MQLTTAQKNLLQKTFLFSGLPEHSFQNIANQSRLLELKAGEELFEQGQPVTDFFFISEGQVKLTRLSSEGDEKVIEIVNSGESFAEAAVFGQFPGYPVNCFAIQRSVVFKICAKSYINELRSSVDSCFSVMTRISHLNHRLLREIDSLTLHNAMHRLAVYLLTGVEESEEGSVEVDLIAPKHVIASRLSVKPETLSRTFKRLVEHGCITMEEKHIVIKDVKAFRELVTLG